MRNISLYFMDFCCRLFYVRERFGEFMSDKVCSIAGCEERLEGGGVHQRSARRLLALLNSLSQCSYRQKYPVAAGTLQRLVLILILFSFVIYSHNMSNCEYWAVPQLRWLDPGFPQR
jgi:hypothetical protein